MVMQRDKRAGQITAVLVWASIVLVVADAIAYLLLI